MNRNAILPELFGVINNAIRAIECVSVVGALTAQLRFHHSTTMSVLCHKLIGPQMNTFDTD